MSHRPFTPPPPLPPLSLPPQPSPLTPPSPNPPKRFVFLFIQFGADAGLSRRTQVLFKAFLLPSVAWTAAGLVMNWRVYRWKIAEKEREEARRRKFISWGWPRSWCEIDPYE